MKEHFLLISLKALSVCAKDCENIYILENAALYFTALHINKLSSSEKYKLLMEYGNCLRSCYDLDDRGLSHYRPLGRFAVNILDRANEISAPKHKIFFREYCSQNFCMEFEDWCSILYVMKLMHLDCSQLLMEYESYCRFKKDYLSGASELADLGTPIILVSVTIFNNFLSRIVHESLYDKKEKEMMKFLMYLGIASIIGKKRFALTTSNMIKARMFGCARQKDLKYCCEHNDDFKRIVDKYTTRRRYDSMIKDLNSEGLICEIPYKRSTAVSLRIKDHLELLQAADNRMPGNRRRKVTESKKAALKAFREMKATPSQP